MLDVGAWMFCMDFLRALQNLVHPLLIIQIPAHRFTNALLEFVGWGPAELILNLGGVDGVSAVVAGPIFYEGDEFSRTSPPFRRPFVGQNADDFKQPDVRPFVIAAAIVSFAQRAARLHPPQRPR